MSDQPLRTASIQEIQLELLRRTTFNALEGERVCVSLRRHKHLWTAALLDRPGVANYSQPAHLLTGGLIKLRDLPDDVWNADTLFIMTPTPQAAEQLAAIISREDWGGEVQIHSNRRETDDALGMGRMEYGLLSIWWD